MISKVRIRINVLRIRNTAWEASPGPWKSFMVREGVYKILRRIGTEFIFAGKILISFSCPGKILIQPWIRIRSSGNERGSETI